MITVQDRDSLWAAANWPLCQEGIDPVATYGPESREWRDGIHPADRYWAIIELQVRDLGDPGDEGDYALGLATGALDQGVEIGMAWASRYENRHMWTYGLSLFPEHRRRAKGQGYEVGDRVTAALFADQECSAILTMAYSTNPAAIRYNGMTTDGWRGRPHRRHVGTIEDAGGPGVDLWIFQTTRERWRKARGVV